MSAYTEKIAAKILHDTHARFVLVATMGENAIPEKRSWTIRSHPLLDRGLPDYLRQMADSIEQQQKEKRKQFCADCK